MGQQGLWVLGRVTRTHGSLGTVGQQGQWALGWVSRDCGSVGTVRVSGDRRRWGGSAGLGQGSPSLPPDTGRQRSESQVRLD